MFSMPVIDDTLDMSYPVRPKRKYSKIPLAIDLMDLDMICAYVMNTETAYITHATLSNISNLFEILDMRFYESSDTKMARIHFIQEVLMLRLDERISRRKMIKSMVMNRIPHKYQNIIENDIIPEAESTILSKEEIKAINTAIIDKLLHGYILYYKNEFLRVFEKIEGGDYDYLKNIINEFKVTLNALQNEIRNAESYINENTALSLDNFESVVSAAVERLQAPKNKLSLGIQAWNRMLSGGYESGRVYIYTALTGIGKSNILLNSLVQIRNNNKNLKTKDPTKKPAILFITQENSLDETIERLFNLTVSTDDIRKFSKKEIIHLLKTKGGFTYDDGKMNIILRYFADREISTTDIYGIIDNIEKTGNEVVALIHDYVYRIKSSENHTEFRLELGAITNEFGNLAKHYDMPVITATQLTRKASEMLKEALEAGKLDITKLIGDNHVAESWLMANNTDALIAVHKELGLDGKWYYAFKKLKLRGRPGPDALDYFAHEIEENGIKMEEDLHLDTPLSKETLLVLDNMTDVMQSRQAPISVSETVTATENAEYVETSPIDLSAMIEEEESKPVEYNKVTFKFNAKFLRLMMADVKG